MVKITFVLPVDRLLFVLLEEPTRLDLRERNVFSRKIRCNNVVCHHQIDFVLDFQLAFLSSNKSENEKYFQFLTFVRFKIRF